MPLILCLWWLASALAAAPEEIRFTAHYHHGGKKEFVIRGDTAPSLNGSRLPPLTAPLWAPDLALVREAHEAKGGGEAKVCGAGRYELKGAAGKTGVGCLESIEGKKLAAAFARLASFTE
jgi:hypothetical protein